MKELFAVAAVAAAVAMHNHEALERHWRERGLVQRHDVRMNHVPSGAIVDFARVERLVLADFVKKHGGDRKKAYHEWEAAQAARVQSAENARFVKRGSQQ